MKNEKSESGVFLSIMLVLFFALLILKCSKVLDISWLWVTAPLWIMAAIIIIAVIIAMIVVVKNWDKEDKK